MRVGSSAPSDEVDFRWNCQVIKIQASHDRIKKLVFAAAACLEGPMPEPNLTRSRGKKGADKIEGCAICAYLLEREELFEALKASA